MPRNNVLGYFKILSDGTSVKIKPLSIKRESALEVLQNYAYPFSPETIHFENHTFVLRQRLLCDVDYQDKMYFISYDDFGISVWGKTREEVEEAFASSFYFIYKNYCTEKDEKLSSKARELKRKLKSIIKNYYES